MPRMVKPELLSRPPPDSARLKRAGEVGTLTPGSNRIRSLMSVASMVSIWSALMTLTVAGVRDARRSDRVPITMTGSTSVAGASAASAHAGWAIKTEPKAAAAVERRSRLRIMAPLDDRRRCYCERLSESTAMKAWV